MTKDEVLAVMATYSAQHGDPDDFAEARAAVAALYDRLAEVEKERDVARQARREVERFVGEIRVLFARWREFAGLSSLSQRYREALTSCADEVGIHLSLLYGSHRQQQAKPTGTEGGGR